MTPPSAKPEASVSEETAADTATDQTTAATGREAGTVSRRRAAALELRGARKRTAADPEEGEAAPAAGRRARGDSGRGVAGTGTRLGPRARASRVAQAEAVEAALQPEATPVLTQTTDGGFDLSDPDTTPIPEDDAEAEVLAQTAATPEAPPAPQVALAPPPVAPVALAPSPPPPAAPQPAPAGIEDPQDDEDDEDDRPGGGRRRARAEKRNSRSSKNDAANYVVAPTANPAVMRPRHYGVIASFFLFVIVPTISFSTYLWTRSADQYESQVGFGSRTEEAATTFDFLGALGGTSTTGSKDMDILNQFIISQELVAKVDAKLDLKTIYTKPQNDPLNVFRPDGTIEDLVDYWQKMVLVSYDNGTGLMNLRIFAFDPVDAQNIARVVLDESTRIINDLSQTAQEDTTRYSKEALAATQAKLAEARLAVLDFQVKNRIVDPSNVISNQLSVVSTLNQQLAAAQIELDMLSGTVPDKDPRIATINRRIEVIRNRIAEEQSKVGANADTNSPGFAKLMADFESLKVSQDFAQQAYLSALAAHDQAIADAQHKTRYLATYVAPTLAEASTAPVRPISAALTALIGFLLWSVTVLIYYALRDRR